MEAMDSTGPTTTRRTFIILAASTAAAAAAIGTASSAEAATPDGDSAGIAGTVRTTSEDCLVVDSHGRLIEIMTDPTTPIYGGLAGDVSSPLKLQIGDFVVAEGALDGRRLHASRVGSVLTPFLATVREVLDDGTLVTTAGVRVDPKPLRLPGMKERPSDTHGISPGAEVQGPAWVDPRNGATYLFVQQ